MEFIISIFKPLYPYFKKNAPALWTGFVFMLIQNWGLVKVPSYIKLIIDEVTHTNSGNVILNYSLWALFYTFIMSLSLFLMRKLIIGASRHIEYDFRAKIYDKLLQLDYDFYRRHNTGDLVSRSTNDLNDVRTLLGPGLMYIPNALSRFVLFIPVLISLSPRLMLAVSVVLVFLMILIILILPRLRPMFQKIQEYTGKINNRAWQVITGITTVKLHHVEEVEKERFRKLNEEYIDKQMAVAKFRGFVWPMFIFIFSIAEIFIILIGGRQVISGTLTLGELMQFNILLSYLTFPVLALGWVMSLIQQGLSAMKRITEILDAPVEERQDWFVLDSESIQFDLKNLTYSYYPDQEPVLKNITLSIRQGEVIGITGTIGSGKTTLINLLTGLLKSREGMIFINGLDIQRIKPEDVFCRVSVVTQNTFLFSKTLEENIAVGNNGDVDETKIKEAVRLAGLLTDVEGFPDQYKQMIGERGITLSGGQKQRASIARALVNEKPVLILDDSLSSVDANTEAEILNGLRKLDRSRTIIIISHRISPLKNADKIFVLDDGELIESGTHQQLAESDGLYARLARMQQMEEYLEVYNQ